MSIRRFDSKRYFRILRSEGDLSSLAKMVRNRGYNARVIKNRNSQSLYVRPRRYYAPIPETDVSRIGTFPIALARATSRRNPNFDPRTDLATDARALVNLAPESALGIGDTSDSLVWDDLLTDLDRAYRENQEQIEDQEKEINEFLDDLTTTRRRIKVLQEKSDATLKALANGDLQTKMGKSNLDEDEWGIIQGTPEITKLFESEKAEETTVNALMQGLMPYFQGLREPNDAPDDYEFTKLNDGRVAAIKKSNGEIMFKVNSNWFDQYFAQGSQKILEAWRIEFVNYLRANGVSEHSFLASELMDDLDRAKDLEYWNWDNWDQNLFKQKMAKEKFSLELNDKQKEGIIALLDQLGITQEITKNRAYSRRKFIESEDFNNNTYARKKIAEYIWDRRLAGDNIVATDDIQAHLSKNMMKPPVMAQTTKFLSQDPRFKEMGYNRKVKLWSIDD